MPTLPSQPTTAYTSPDECCDCCESCHCGTDCATGTVSMNRTYLATNFGSFSIGWYGQFKNSGGSFADPQFYAGTNILVEGWAYATVNADGLLAFTWGPSRALWFNATSPYAAQFGARQVLTLVNSGNDYRIFDPDTGIAYTFDIASGLLSLVTMPGGQTLTNTIASGKVTQSIWRDASSNIREVRKFTYTAGLLEYATLQRTTDDGTQFARVALAYYDGSTSNGNSGDLRSVTYQVPGTSGWEDVGTDYFRYYKTSTSTSFVHGLRYAVRPEEYAILFASTSGNPDSATDQQVATVADAAYQYDQTSRRVTLSTTLGGQAQSFEYTDNTETPTNNFNHWLLKMVVTYADYSQKTIYSNTVRQVMLTDHVADPMAPNQGRWIDFTKYHDTYGRVIERYTPAAIDMSATPIYTDTALDLSVAIRLATGLVNVTDYYGASPPSGGVAGYPSQTSVRAGASGTSNVLRALEYGTETVSGDTLVYLSKSTKYRNTNTTGPIVTLFSLAFHSGTLQVQIRTTKLPIVPTSQNGDEIQYAIVETFDLNGWLTNRTDAFDFDDPPSHKPSTAYVHDADTGAVTQMTQDPGGLAIVTDYSVDSFGRTTLTIGPTHNVNGQSVRTLTWNAYLDAQHEVRTAQGYRVSTTDTLVNPVSITKMDRDGRVLEEIEATGASAITDSFALTSYSRLTTRTYTSGDLTAVKVYHDIPTTLPGTRDLNYAEMNHGYDSMGRRVKTTSPGNGGSDGVGGGTPLRTITWNVLDVRDNVIETYVGTNDFGGTDADPDANSETTANNMIKTATFIFDNDNPVGGNGLLTREMLHVDGSPANDRITGYAYDFRDRRTTTTQDPDGSQPIITLAQYDNVDQVIQVDQYQNSATSANRIGESKTYFDDRRQVYLTESYGVTPGNGTPVNPQASKTWYDGDGRAVKQHPAGSKGYSKTKYDDVGRVSDTYVGYSPSNNDDPWTIGAGDTIFEQSHNDYDAAGNVVKTTGYQRNVDATGTGELTTSNARATYVGQWFDGIGRPIATANYGTSTFDRGAVTSAPSSSDDVLVSLTAYNARGEAYQTTDPKGMVTERTFDDAGRQTSVEQSGTDDGTQNTTTTSTSMTYTPDGGVRTIAAANATTGVQTTQFNYGTDRPNNVFNTVARSDLIVAEIYPDSEGGTDNISYEYNRQADRVEMTDQNETVHQYDYDRFGRPTADNITHFESSDIDQTVKRIEIAYEVRGMVNQVTSKSAVSGGSVINQVTFEYNNFRQLVTDSQKHSASATAIDVEYQYENGSQNTTRRNKIIYPSTRALDILYESGADDALSRVSQLKINGETNAAATYKYFGLGSIAKVSYPQPAVSMTLAQLVGGVASYPGIDKFGRIVDLHWKKDSGGTPDRVRLQYGYDRASNRKFRKDMIARSIPEPFDELYKYDGVHRLTWFGRGTLDTGDASLSDTTQRQIWTLDQTGNWTQFDQDSPVLTQLRLHNEANEILPNYPEEDPDRIDKTAGIYWAGPLHDANGNMTKMPKPAALDEAYTAKYDAWNRLVELRDAATTNLVASFRYDGLNRRTIKTVSGTDRHFFYSDQWQVLEERIGSSTNPDRQFVWGIRYIDDLVLRDRDADANGTLDERLFAVQDANWNVVAILDIGGAVDERFAYEAYGHPIELDNDFAPQTDVKDWDTRFTGQRFDRNAALYLFRNRYYHDLLGRFVTRDPLQGESNLYCYCANNPVVGIDPTGLFTVEGPRGYRREGDLNAVIGGYFNFFPRLDADGPFLIQDVEVTGSLVCTTSDGCYNVVGFRYSWTEVWPFRKKVADTHLNSPKDPIAFLKKHCPCPCDLKKPWIFTATAEFVAYAGMIKPSSAFAVTPVEATTTYRCEGANDEGTSINGKGAIMSMYPGKRAADPTAPTPLSRKTLTRLGVPAYDIDTWVCINGNCKYTSTGYIARGGAGK